MSKYTVSSSEGYELHFQTLQEYKEYQKVEKQLKIKFYLQQRLRYGIWCSNQDKFVKTRDQMQEWDSKYMEDLIKDFL